MLLALASAKGAPGTTTSAHVLAAVWPAPVLLVDADPAGSDLLYRLRTEGGLPLDSERGLLSLAAAVRNNPGAAVEEHTTVVEGGLDVLLGMPRPEQATAIASNWGAIAARLRTRRDVLCDVGRLVPGSPSLPIAMSADLLLLVTRPGVDAYAHLRDRLRWILTETAHRAERPDLGVLLIAPWKQRHEADDLTRLLHSGGVDVPVVGTLALDDGAADSLAGRRPRPLRRTLLVRSARALVASLPVRTGIEAGVGTGPAPPPAQQGYGRDVPQPYGMEPRTPSPAQPGQPAPAARAQGLGTRTPQAQRTPQTQRAPAAPAPPGPQSPPVPQTPQAPQASQAQYAPRPPAAPRTRRELR